MECSIVCKRAEEIAYDLEERLKKGVDEIMTPQFRKYVEHKRLVRWPGASLEEAAQLTLKEALAYALLTSAKCALCSGDFKKAEELFERAAAIFRELAEREARPR